MNKIRMMPIHCSLCGTKHDGQPIENGWFAEFKPHKKFKITRLICPDCRQRLGIKADQSVKSIDPAYQKHDTVDNQPQQIRRLL